VLRNLIHLHNQMQHMSTSLVKEEHGESMRRIHS